MTPEDRAREAFEELLKTRHELDERAAEMGLLRPPGESCDPPDRSDRTLLKATSETYADAINRAGWVLVVYCTDSHWPMNALYGGQKTYTSPKPRYNIAGAVLTMARKLAREGRFSAVLVDTSRCSIGSLADPIYFVPTLRLYQGGVRISDYEVRHKRRGSGSAASQVLTWIEQVMAKNTPPTAT